MNLHDLVVVAPKQMLLALAGQLDKAVAWGKENGVSADELLQKRLAPDMFPLLMQVKFISLQARETVWRLRGDEVVMWESGDTMDEMKALIARTVSMLDEVKPEDFDGAEDRVLSVTLPNAMMFELEGADFVRDWAIPQFHFHAVTAYAILRNAGVDLGKADYVPHMLPHLRPVTTA
ncbi:hypothetical protein HY29_05895 [Hyphomonas beringensis]|uniref:DUF1993 domain-containing protein n=1 Tax=Hyphomonas beringensis TaxID=1280946 RepID=A0A062TTT7_9PROT|nr:DUF1993 domain-containing protein [Hyphomonas beringensis]KCZ51396.1 hypothetical protein HY29_05895 [Hyphomonas beringensis]